MIADAASAVFFIHPPGFFPHAGETPAFSLEVSIMSNIASDTHRSALDETAWRAVCETAAKQAIHGCGQSHDWYVERFSSEVDAQVHRLPEHQQAYALQIAEEYGDYATPAERHETQDWNAENGICMHGIDRDCCPAGCGDLEY
ncbi:TPA: hypothetical protein L5P25_003032 [Pseudomonas aeruginosa]|uniref:hypothetical protein n=1 Tax=Gammaproteobacteria TaxID=1236 RepID=UPI000382D89F|nr:hypothetical protein APB36_14655 [Pseudomonas aeruginosa]PJO51666.1 hypothetical protein CR156_05385 [Stenotrophomonas lactitubi]HBP0062103.1 hypothetical protein [Pseudomonas aeruginosa]HBP0239868.1 hypothetical protein [Pseudomonas aeruginosa]